MITKHMPKYYLYGYINEVTKKCLILVDFYLKNCLNIKTS